MIIRYFDEASTRTMYPLLFMAYFFPAGGGGSRTPAKAASSSGVEGLRRFCILKVSEARFSCCKNDIPLLAAVVTGSIVGAGGTGPKLPDSVAVADAVVVSWVAVCCVAPTVAGADVVFALSFFPQPEEKMMAPKAGIRSNPWIVDRRRTHRAESEIVFM